MNIFDLDIYGREDTKGNPIVHGEEDAVKNALIMWVTSGTHDYLYQPGAGGLLNEFEFKTMNSNTLRKLQTKIKNNVILYFTPTITLYDIGVEPDYERRMITVTIYYYGVISGAEEQVDIYIQGQVEKVSFNYVDIVEDGENLYSIVKLKKPGMENKKMIMNYDLGVWVWGKYKFVNLEPTDPYFTSILQLING